MIHASALSGPVSILNFFFKKKFNNFFSNSYSISTFYDFLGKIYFSKFHSFDSKLNKISNLNRIFFFNNDYFYSSTFNLVLNNSLWLGLYSFGYFGLGRYIKKEVSLVTELSDFNFQNYNVGDRVLSTFRDYKNISIINTDVVVKEQ